MILKGIKNFKLMLIIMIKNISYFNCINNLTDDDLYHT